MASIFDFVTARNIVSYWNNKNAQETEGLLGEELFPERQKLGLGLEWVKGSSGLPVVLLPSAYDVVALKRDRIGFEEMATKMPFFKESVMIDEELRQQLNIVLETGKQEYINMVMTKIFDDETRLLRGAKAQRERMRMMLLTTGGISIKANGQNYDYDYGMKSYQKVTVSKSWSDADADIIGDIRTWQDTVEEQTGTRPTRAVVSKKTFQYFMTNTTIKNILWRNGLGDVPSEGRVKSFFLTELGLSIVTYSKKYIDEAGTVKNYVPDDLFSLFPAGALGTGWFGTTPEQSDLMTGSAANVAITDVGVAVTTMKKYDPVNVDTKVSMIYLPSFEAIDKVIIADLVKPTQGS